MASRGRPRKLRLSPQARAPSRCASGFFARMLQASAPPLCHKRGADVFVRAVSCLHYRCVRVTRVSCLEWPFVDVDLELHSHVSLGCWGSRRVVRGARALQQWPCLFNCVRLRTFSHAPRHLLLRQRTSQVAVALDVGAAKRRHPVGKSRACGVALPTGALPVAADGPGVADAQAAARRLFGRCRACGRRCGVPPADACLAVSGARCLSLSQRILSAPRPLSLYPSLALSLFSLTRASPCRSRSVFGMMRE